jgi:hypothetical protein
MKTPTETEIGEMIQVAMKDVERESGGEFDKYAAAFFSTGFKLGIIAMLQRGVLSEMSTDDRTEH